VRGQAANRRLIETRVDEGSLDRTLVGSREPGSVVAEVIEVRA
jgi:hypothetical protein